MAMLTFVRDTLLGLGTASVLSVGCGCGFLEWLLSCASEGQIRVEGLEVLALLHSRGSVELKHISFLRSMLGGGKAGMWLFRCHS